MTTDTRIRALRSTLIREELEKIRDLRIQILKLIGELRESDERLAELQRIEAHS